MKKIKKSLPSFQKASIDFDQLSQIKGGDSGPFDLFQDASKDPYIPWGPPTRS